jgi:hypothetical protein
MPLVVAGTAWAWRLPPGRVPRAALAAALVALALGVVAALIAPQQGLHSGLELTLGDGAGRERLRRAWPEAGLEALAARLPPGVADAGPLLARVEGLWHVDRGGAGELWLKADGEGAVRLDGREVLRRPAGSPSRSRRRAWELEPGWHRVALELSPEGESTFAKLQWAPAGGPPRDLDGDALFRSRPTSGAVARRSLARGLALAALASALAAWGLLALLALRARRDAGGWPRWWLLGGLPLGLVTSRTKSVKQKRFVTCGMSRQYSGSASLWPPA